MTLFRTIASIITVCSVLAIRCTPTSNQSTPAVSQGNGENIGTGMVTGMVYAPDGITPAKGASVVVRYKNSTVSFASATDSTTNGALYTTITDTNGVFSFDTIAEGLYVIECSDDRGGMALYDSVHIGVPPEPVILPPDTLKPSGAITGTIELPDGGNYLQVFVLAFGVDRFCQVRSDGSFTFGGFARGVYTIRILPLDPAYLSVDLTGIRVTSGDTTSVGTIELPLNNGLAPTGVRVEYDSMRMITKVSWEPIPPGVIKGYNIYRQPLNETGGISNSIRLNGNRLLTDTAFTDSMIADEYLDQRLTSRMCYAVTAIDLSGNESRPGVSAAVTFLNAWELYDSMTLELPRPVVELRGSSLDPDDGLLLLVNDIAGACLLRYSRSGDLSSSRPIPDSLENFGSCRVLQCDPAGDVWFLPDTESDSAYIHHLLPSGAFADPILVAMTWEGCAACWDFNLGGMVIENQYYCTYNGVIRKIDLATGQTSTVKDLSLQEKRGYLLVPARGEGFAVAMIGPVVRELDEECLVTPLTVARFNAEGAELEKIPMHTISYEEELDDPEKFLANNWTLLDMNDSTVYFDRFFYRRNAQGVYSRGAMPVHSTLDHMHVRSDGMVVVISTPVTGPFNVRSYRFRN